MLIMLMAIILFVFCFRRNDDEEGPYRDVKSVVAEAGIAVCLCVDSRAEKERKRVAADVHDNHNLLATFEDLQ